MFQLLFLGSLFSALLTVYILIFKRDALKTYADYLLSVFVVFLSWNVLIYLLLHYNLIDQVPYLFKTAAPLAFAVPALSYLYTRAVLYNETRFQVKDLYHFIPFVIVFFNYLPFYILPLEEKEKIVELISKNLDLSFTYQLGIISEQFTNSIRIFLLILYNFIQWSLVIKYKQNFKVIQVENQVKETLKWLKLFTWTCTFGVVAFFIIALFFLSNRSLFNNFSFISLLPLIFNSVSFFIISSYLLIHPIVLNGLPFIKYKEMGTNLLTDETMKIPFIIEDYTDQIQRINHFFEDQKHYLNKDLSMVQVSASLDIPIRDLSYILNNYFNLRFTDFVNQYRIKHVITIFNDSYLDNFTIESAAFEAGFTSKSGFYKSFKKLYKMTPTEYFQNIKPSNLTKE
jgi:AraC-like DNA-binding protein